MNYDASLWLTFLLIGLATLLPRASFIVLGAVCGDGVRIRDAAPRQLRMTQITLEKLGIHFAIEGEDVFIPGGQKLEVDPDFGGSIPSISDAPWPGFPADAMSVASSTRAPRRSA